MWFRIIFAALLVYGAITGWKHGLVKEACSSFGVLIGIILAYRYYDVIGYGIWGFALICLAVPIVLGILASMVSYFLNHLFVIGFVHRLAGALLGMVKYAILLGVTYWLGDQMGFMD